MRFRESETTELKKSTADLKEAVVSVGAILNKHRRGKLGFLVTFLRPPKPAQTTALKTAEPTPQATPQVVAVLKAARTASSREELQKAVDLKDRRHFRKAYLDSLLGAGWLEMMIPEKPRSPKQSCRTTDLGRKVLDQWRGRK